MGPLCNAYQKAQIDKRIKICRRLCPNLDWLSFYFTVCYRVSFLMFKCIHSRSPIYLSSKLLTNNNYTRAGSRGDFIVHRAFSNSFMGSFCFFGPNTFNGLPFATQKCSDARIFCKETFVHYSNSV